MKYVYKHLDSKGKIFYIGCGVLKRVYSKNLRNKDWQKRANNGFTSHIIAILPREAALKLEIKIQKSIGLENLTNQRIGSTPIHSLETLEKMRLAPINARKLKNKT